MQYDYVLLGDFAEIKFSEKEIIYALVNKKTATYLECTNLLDDSKFKIYFSGSYGNYYDNFTYGREKRRCNVQRIGVPKVLFKRMACELIVACQNDFDIEYNSEILHVTFKKAESFNNQIREFQERYLGRITIFSGFTYTQCKGIFEILKKAVKETSDSAIEKYFEEARIAFQF